MALVSAFPADLGTQWTDELAEAWHSAYDMAAEAMMLGSSPVRDRQPGRGSCRATMSNGYSGARPRSTACSMATEQPVNTRAESERNMNHPTTLDRAITANHSEVLLGRALTANHSEVLLGRAFTSNHSEVLLGSAE